MTARKQPGWRMPAEWEPHAATWLVFAHNARDWPGKFAAARWAYVEIIRHLHRRETVFVVVQDAGASEAVKRLLSRAGVAIDRLQFVIHATDRSWARDSGPTFVTGGEGLGAVCWRFNAWAKYADRQRDATLGRAVAKRAGAAALTPRARGKTVVMEGGAIDGNGLGALLATEECLLAGGRQARNPGLGRGDIERLFENCLGARKVLWLDRGIAGDDTHGHIDDIARFVGPRTVAAATETNPKDENYAPLQENLKRLRSMTDQSGRPLEVVELPMPRPLYFAGARLPASYANFYVANGIVLAPTFNDPNDRAALDILAECFPDREVCGIHCVDMVWGFGAIHCATQQQPSIALAPGAALAEAPPS